MDCLVKRLVSPGAEVPAYQTPEAAGADISACLVAPVTPLPGTHGLVPTGLRFEIPPGYGIQVRPRSGLAAKAGVTVLNSPGTIDSDYRGEVQVILVNHGAAPFVINHGDRIAQAIVAPVIQAHFLAADALGGTERGEGGFGSTDNSNYPEFATQTSRRTVVLAEFATQTSRRTVVLAEFATQTSQDNSSYTGNGGGW